MSIDSPSNLPPQGNEDEEEVVERISDTEILLYKKIGSGTYGLVVRGIWYPGTAHDEKYLSSKGLDVAKAQTEGVKIAYKQSLLVRDYQSWNRELSIYNKVSSCPHVAKFYGMVRSYETPTPEGILFSIPKALIFEYVHNMSCTRLYHVMSLRMIQFVSRCLLEAISSIHSRGIIHCDIKPDNIAIDPTIPLLRLLDFGHAQMEKGALLDQVGSRAYQSPEQHLGLLRYSFPIDMYATGRVLFEMLLPHSFPVLRGANDVDQIKKLTSLYGNSSMQELRKLVLDCNAIYKDARKQGTVSRASYSIKPANMVRFIAKIQKVVPLKLMSSFKERKERYCIPEALDLVEKLLDADFRRRITAEEALNHPFYKLKIKGDLTVNEK